MFRASHLVGCLAIFCGGSLLAADSVDFNRDIRPILSNHCFKCHGPDAEERQANLRLDTREGAFAESDGGLAIVPGKPQESLLIERITADDQYERMPPPETGLKLSEHQIDLFRQWIDQGAKWEGHWSFQPPQRAELPPVKDAAWTRNAIDRFVLARLEANSLAPSPAATRYELIRRLSLDLTGLPPTMEEADAFVSDESPDAHERLVDRLLASPAYGERWARVWLDLARYADSAGYAQDPPRTIWRYRDWVIEAINSGMPFDQFTVEQIAGDMLNEPTEDQLLATAFHRNTMTNSEGGTDDEEFRNAAIVDRVNTTMQAWMGLTMECAQCHNHKYDPISQEEYYKFFAVFNNTADADRGNEEPNLTTLMPQQRRARERIKTEISGLEQVVAKKLAKQDDSNAKPQATVADGPLKTRFVRIEQPGRNVVLHLAEVQAFVGERNVATGGKASQVSTAYDGPAKLAIDGNTNGDYFAAKSTSHTAQGDDPWWEVDLGKAQVLDRLVLWNRTDNGLHARLKNFRVVALDEERQPLWIKTVGPSPNPSAEWKLPLSTDQLGDQTRAEIARYVSGESTPANLPEQKQIAELKKKLENIKGVPTPIMQELPEGRRRTTNIHIRGNFRSKGEEVSPGVPAALHPLPTNSEDAPNRLDVARWLIDETNPLTARVVVNRYWELLFGAGLVETSEDFGAQGELPSHPRLLDYLAVELMRHDWDTKWLVRTIVTSATYRQTSRVTPELAQADPNNRQLSRGPRFRLSAEMIRDQALAVGGLLSTKMYGESVRPPRPNLGLKAAFGGSTDWQPSPGEDRYRRGLYTRWRRTTPYPSFMTFDATSREVCTIRRVRTNTPLQALVTLNDPVFVEAAQALARRIVSEVGMSSEERAAYGFRLALTRPPSEAEVTRLVALYDQLLVRYREDAEAANKMATQPIGPPPEGADVAELAAWTVVGNVLLNLDETLAKR